MKTYTKKIVNRRVAGNNTWLSIDGFDAPINAAKRDYNYRVLDSEAAVGRAMFDELVTFAREKDGDISIVLLGGRGAQAMYRLIRIAAEAGEIDGLLSRLNVFTQDALAPMRMDNGLSFVRDFERLLGPKFFAKIKSFTPIQTDAADLEGEFGRYLDKLDRAGGIDLFFLGLGPESEAASHLCYIKPGSGASLNDFAGIIPISASILEHHIAKFKAGGTAVSPDDEAECRRASHILTLGPAAILSARRIIQSIVDASTAPGKRDSFKRLIDTEIATDSDELSDQIDNNPGLLIRLHSDVRTYVLPDLISE